MSTQEDDEVTSEREAVETYLRFNELEEVLNGILNELVTDRPQDPYLALSNILVDHSRESRKIIDVRACEVLGPVGCCLQVEVKTTKGLFLATVGGYGYDEDPTRHYGKGYGKVINTLNALIVPKLKGTDPADQAGVDKLLSEEGTLSEAARLAVSMAVCRAGAKQAGQEVFQYIAEMANNYNLCTPVPHMAILEGGRAATNKLVARSVVIMPYGASSFEEAYEIALQVQKKLETELQEKNDACFGQQGGLAPCVESMDEALSMVRGAIKAAGVEGKVAFGVDVSAQDFAELVRRSGEDDAMYNMSTWDPEASPPTIKKKDEMLDLYTELLVAYPFVSVSEPFHPNQKSYYGRLNENCKQFIQGAKGDAMDAYKMHCDGIGGDKDCVVQIVGDASLKTEADIEEATTKKTMNTVRVSLRKAGTVSSLIKLVQKAQAVGFGVIVAADGREMSDALDVFAAHAAVGLRTGQVDFGSLRGPLEKYSELLRIERVGGVSYAAGTFRTFR